MYIFSVRKETKVGYDTRFVRKSFISSRHKDTKYHTTDTQTKKRDETKRTSKKETQTKTHSLK